LHDWKRLLSKTTDLAQLKGEAPRRDIPWEEIRQHNKNHDGWVVLRGKVYNIGPYLPYHPGGVAVFRKVLGGDGTAMFDKYHRWVNIDGLIGPLFIGTAAPTAAARAFNPYSVVPSNESHLTNAPRIQVQQVLSSTSMLGRESSNTKCDDDDGDDDDDGEALFLPPPASRPDQI
jgi:cytochrome-b5 reductase